MEKIIKIIKNHQQYQKLPVNLQNLHDKVKMTKIAKVEKTEKLPPVSLLPARKRTTDFPEKCAENTRSNVNLLGVQITSRSNAHGRDWHAGQLRSRDHFRDLFQDHFEGALSKSHLNADLL